MRLLKTFISAIAKTYLLINLISCVSPDKQLPNIQTTIKSGTPDPKLWSVKEREISAGYHFLVGQYKELSGDLNGASKHYEIGYGLDPNPYLGGKTLAVAAALGNNQTILVDARKMTLLYPKSSSLQFLYGQVLAMHGDLQKSEESVERAIKLDDNLLEAYLFLVELAVQQKKNKLAISRARKLVQKFPGKSGAWTTLAKLYIKVGNSKKAEEAARKAYELQDQSSEIAVVYAYSLEMNGKTEKAAKIYERVFRISPGSEQLAAHLVKLYRSLGGLKKALEMLEDMIPRVKGSALGLNIQKAFVLWEMDEFEKAAVHLGELSIKSPESQLVKYMSGLAQEKVGKFEEAISYYQSILDSSPFKIHARFRASLILFNQGNFQDALVEARPILSNPLEADSYIFVAGIYQKLDDSQKSLEVIELGIKKYPGDPDLWFSKGVYLEKLGKIEDCLAVMRQVIKLDSNYANAYNYIGYIYAEQGDNLEEAEQLLLKALELKPEDGFFLDSLGWIYYRKGEYQKAKVILEKAASQLPNEGVIWHHLGDLYTKLDDKQKALQHYEKAIQLLTTEDEKERIRQKIESLDS